MQQVASGLNKSKRQSFLNIAIAGWDHRDCLAGDNLEKDIFNWLSPPDPWKNHHVACESRHRGSATWFIQGSTFLEWKSSESRSSLLWVHGKRALMPSSYASVDIEFSPFRSWRWKKCILVRQTFDFPVSGAYRVGKRYNHRGRRGHAESWTRFVSVFLLRFQGGSKEGSTRTALIHPDSTLSSI